MPAQQQLVSVDDISEDNAPLIYVSGGLKPFIDRVRAEVSGEVPDLSTKKGRDRIASQAAKVSKSKVAVEKPGREYLKRLKEMPKVVEAELREFVQEMDKLRDEVRAPLTEWEEAEEARVSKHKAGIEWFRSRPDENRYSDSAQIRAAIAEVQAVKIGDPWQEFEAEALRAKANALEALSGHLASRERHEAEQAELARLRAEAAAREQKEREERIARESAEAERLAAERRELELKLAAERAEREAIEAKQRAEQAERDAQARAEAAAAAERQRQADEQARIEREAKAREADKAHKAAINRAALEAFIAGGMPEACAKQAVTLIAKRQIPHITISY